MRWTVLHLTDPSIRVPDQSLPQALSLISAREGRVVHIDYSQHEVVYSDFPRVQPFPLKGVEPTPPIPIVFLRSAQ